MIIEMLDFLVENKCAIDLDSFQYCKMSSSTEQVGEISPKDRIKLAYDISNAKNEAEMQAITDEASKLAYEKSHLKFKWDDCVVPISNIGFNETRANISMHFNINGKVMLPSDSPNNLPKDFPTSIIRNFNVVHDGILNIENMKVKMDNATYALFTQKGFSAVPCGKDEYIIDFTSLALYKASKEVIKAKDVADLAYKLMVNKAKSKVYKVFKEKYNPVDKSEKIISKYGNNAGEYLSYLGITDSGFNPKSQKVESTNSYVVKELLIKFKGMSSIPSYNAVMKKIDEKKNLNNADMLVKEAYDVCCNKEANMNQNDFIAWLKQEIKDVDKEIKNTNRSLAKIKFNVLVGNEWFEEFNSRIGCYIDYNGIKVDFVENPTTIHV